MYAVFSTRFTHLLTVSRNAGLAVLVVRPVYRTRRSIKIKESTGRDDLKHLNPTSNVDVFAIIMVGEVSNDGGVDSAEKEA